MKQLCRIFLSLLLLMSTVTLLKAEEKKPEESYISHEVTFSEETEEVSRQISYEDLFADADPLGLTDAHEEGEANDLRDEAGLLAQGRVPKQGTRLVRYKNNFTPWGYSYITLLYLDDQPVFCIEPEVQFKIVDEYTPVDVDFTSYYGLSVQERFKLWQIVKYGYCYPGHQSNDWYVATQLYIWNTLKKTEYITWTVDGKELNTDYYRNFMKEIDRLIEENKVKMRPSFAGQTVKARLNEEFSLTDSNHVIKNYQLKDTNGIKAVIEGDTLKMTVTSRDFDPSLSFTHAYEAEDALIAYGNESASSRGQMVIDIASSYDPVEDFKIQIDLLRSLELKIWKRDAETGETPQGEATLKGAKFRVAFKDVPDVEYLVETDESGCATLSDLRPGVYLVSEVEAPEGYRLSANGEVEVDLLEADLSVTIPDEVIKGKIRLQKTDDRKDGMIPAEGVTFHIFDTKGKEVGVMTTNADGVATSSDLPYGNYVLKEDVRAGYYPAEEIPVKIDGSQEIVEVSAINHEIYARLKVIKVDQESGKVIPAAHVRFQLLDENKEEITLTEGTFETDENGEAVFPEALGTGTYYLKEVSAPEGYVLSEELYEVKIDDSVDPKTHEVLISFENKAQEASLTVKKYGEMLSGYTEKETEYGKMVLPFFEEKYLGGVSFTLSAKEDIVREDGTLLYAAGSEVARFTTEETGPTTLEHLPLGSYLLKEETTAEGYVRSAKAIPVNLEYAGQSETVSLNEITLTNAHQRARLLIKKELEKSRFHQAEEEYPKVVFGLYNTKEISENGVVIPEGSLMGILSCDKEGKAEAELLLSGEYELRELATSEYYLPLSESIPLSWNYADTTEKITEFPLESAIQNELKKGALAVYKTDEFENPVADAAFAVAADPEFTQVIATIESNSDGIARLEDLEEGTYYVRELRAPEIFEIDTGVHPVEVSFSQESQLLLKNYHRPLRLSVSKTDETGQYLNGSEFSLYREVEENTGEALRLLFVKPEVTVDLNDYLKEKEYRFTSANHHADLNGTELTLHGNSVFFLNDNILILSDASQKEDAILKYAVLADQQISGETKVHFTSRKQHRMPLANAEVILYSDEACTQKAGEYRTDSNGNVLVQNLVAGTYYYQDEEKAVHAVTLKSAQSGMTLFYELERRQVYYLVETGLPEGYDYHEATYSRIDTDTEEEELRLNVINLRRRVEVILEKTDAEEEDVLLNGAEFEIFDLSENKKIGIFCSGEICLSVAEDGVYEVSDTADFQSVLAEESSKDGILRVKEIHGEKLNGSYYVRKQGSTEISGPIEVREGEIRLRDILYGHELECVEIKAPQGYEISSNQPLKLECSPEYDTNVVRMRIGNRKIILYRMGE